VEVGEGFRGREVGRWRGGGDGEKKRKKTKKLGNKVRLDEFPHSGFSSCFS
jgi:hypothetical protein